MNPQRNSRLCFELYSFLGNSLLKVMTADTAFGLEPEFWQRLRDEIALEAAPGHATGHAAEQVLGLVPNLASDHDPKQAPERAPGHSLNRAPAPQLAPAANGQIITALDSLQGIAGELQKLEKSQALERVGVEYTRLFIGPGTPAAPPWETIYRAGGTVLFGQPTSDMRRLFGEQGYQVSAGSHQLEDHIGFELLYLALRFFENDGCLSVAALEELQGFISKHPLSFIPSLYQKAHDYCVENSSPGYYPALLQLAWGLLLREAVTTAVTSPNLELTPD